MAKRTSRTKSGTARAIIAKRRERGFSVLLLAVSASVLLGMLGLTFDLGRMFIVKTELQTFVDASALAAVKNLDGSGAGVRLAHAVATAGPLGATRPNGTNFDTNPITAVTDTYGTQLNGTYVDYNTAQGSSPNTYSFINLAATANVSLYFLGVIPGLAMQQTVTATATGGEMALPAVTQGGLTPFSPDAHNPGDTTHFGFIPGQEYTLKWGNGNTTTCAGDAGFNPGNAPDAHGYVNLGQGTGTSNLDKAIIYGGYPNSLSVPSVVDSGDNLSDVPGNRGASVFASLAARSAQDTDQTSLTWAQYQAAGIGNDRRVVTAAINNPALDTGTGSNGTVTVIGFGNFLLDPSATISGSSGPICATYIGPANLNGAASAVTDGTTVYTIALFK
jgi:Flp pilus assembly protein TadG